MESDVSICGSVQQYAQTSKYTVAELLDSFASSKSECDMVTFIDSKLSSSIHFAEVYDRARNLDLKSRCRLSKGNVVVICLPAGITAVIAAIAAILSNCILVPIAFDDSISPSDLANILVKTKADVMITTREKLMENEYPLHQGRVLGASLGGDGPLVTDAVDLTREIDPKLPRLARETYSGSDRNESFLYLYDEKTKLLWDVTNRAASAIIQSCVRTEDAHWREKVVPQMNGLHWLSEILPRILSRLVTKANEEEARSSIVFDPSYKPRVRRRPVRRALASSPTITDQEPPKSVEVLSDVARLFLCAGRNQLGSIDRRICLGARPDKTSTVIVKGKVSQGSLCLFGPGTFRRVVGDISRSSELLFLDQDFRLWLDLGETVSVNDDIISPIVESSASPLITVPRSEEEQPQRPRRVGKHVPRPSSAVTVLNTKNAADGLSATPMKKSRL